VDTTSWKIYNNKKYRYSLKYPPDYRLSEQDVIEGFKIENPDIIVTEKYPPLREDHLLIEAGQDEFECSNTTVPNGLFAFAASQWGINKNRKGGSEMSNLSEILINGTQGYEYNLTGSYSKEGCGGELFYTQQTFVYLEKNGNIFTFRYPSQNNTYRQIIETLSFEE